MTDPHTMTLAQLCDWHAERAGWKYEPEQADGMGDTRPYWWKYTISPEHGGRTYSQTHPFPPTRDGAASAMPEGWIVECNRMHWYATPVRFEAPIYTRTLKVDRTNDEPRDRYLLAAEAVMKEAGE